MDEQNTQNTEKPICDAPGVYKILNLINGKFYIGSTNNLRKRRNKHIVDLRHHKHACHHLRYSFDKYGESAFKFICIEFCAESELKEKEQYWLDEFWDRDILYNTYKEAYAVRGVNHPLYGTHRSEEVKEKIRQKRKFQIIKHSDETKRKIGKKSALHRHTAETRLKISKSKLGCKSWSKGETILTNESLRKAGEAASIKIPGSEMDLIILKYKEGDSLLKLSMEFPYGWYVIRKNLMKNGILIRSLSEQKIKSIEVEKTRNFRN
jgi:group I intron endonuclease